MTENIQTNITYIVLALYSIQPFTLLRNTKIGFLKYDPNKHNHERGVCLVFSVVEHDVEQVIITKQCGRNGSSSL